MPGEFRPPRSNPAQRWILAERIACSLALSTVFWGMSSLSAAEPVYSKSLRFRIPFQFDAEELQRLGAQEVQLHTSHDGGAHWALSDSTTPETNRFTFEAPMDGEYWFSVKTIAASGLEYPAGPPRPSLQVIVDSTPPQFDVQLDEAEPGRVRLSWDARDAHLDTATLNLEFTEPDGTFWVPVRIRAEERGQTTWTISHNGMVRVRGSIADMAGNSVDAQAEVLVSPAQDTEPERPDYSHPVASDPGPSKKIAVNSPLDSVTTNRPATTPGGPYWTSTPPETPRLLIPGSPSTNPPPVNESRGADTTMPQAQNRAEHLVNSTLFRITYEIDGIGTSGVGIVELYITEDGGQQWFHYGNDPDRVSPVEVSVPKDGDYGFAFRVTNGLGLTAPPPQPGDRPDVSVTVDRQPPVAKLLPIQPGPGRNANQLLIEWTAEDHNLDANPIVLYYGLQPSGPWEVIQSAQQNTGRFLWTLPDSLNQKFYVRLDVRDAAGNVAHVVGDQPYVLDRSRPRARVTEVESLNSGQR